MNEPDYKETASKNFIFMKKLSLYGTTFSNSTG